MSQTAVEEVTTKARNVEQSRAAKWRVEISELGGKVVGRWESAHDFMPTSCAMVLYLEGTGEVGRTWISGASGRHPFALDAGTGYRLALVAGDFQGNEVEIVTTDTTGGRQTLAKEVQYTFRIAVGKNAAEKAQLTWESNAPFRPRQSKAFLYVEGESPKEYWIDGKPSDSVDTGVRWGVGLRGAYTAEDYDGARRPVVETATTRRESD